MSLDDSDGKILLTMQFSAKPTTFAARLMSMMGFLFNGAMRRMIQRDLSDIRQGAEKAPEHELA